MDIKIQNKIFKINPDDFGGILKDMFEENYKTVDLSHLNSRHFDLMLTLTSTEFIDIKDLVAIFKIAFYLNIESKMKLFGKEIANKISNGNIKYIKEIVGYFDD